MKKEIYTRFLLIILITALISGVISTFFASVNKAVKFRESAVQMCRAVSERYSDYPQAAYWSELLGGARVTIITSDGYVLDDSHTDTAEMENHFKRKEVLYAHEGYVATDIRPSDTLGKSFMYAATKMDDTILRIALPYGGITKSTWEQLPIFTVSLLLSLLFSALIARRFANKIINPLECFIQKLVVEDYDYLKTENSYYEIDRITAKIRTLLHKIQESQREIKLEKEKTDLVLSDVKEGFIWLDHDTNITLINKSAINIFNAGMPLSKTTFIELTRNKQLVEGVRKAVSEEQASLLEWKTDDKIFSVRISPIDGKYVGSEKNGAGVLLLDIGNEKISRKQRSEFFANASHELKTPITTLMGFSEMLKNGTLPEEKREQIYSRIYSETQRMSNLIGDILTISRLESGMTEDCIEKVNIADIAKEVIQSQEPQADEKSIAITCQCQDVLIMANSRRVWDLLSNLIDNAIKYNKVNGSVTVEVYSFNDNANIKISDTGLGIRKTDHTRIFERFYRSDTGTSKMIKGTGLGLSIVKHIVNSYGGSICLKSSLGVGTEITVTLPIM